jgi:hypothetical protein
MNPYSCIECSKLILSAMRCKSGEDDRGLQYKNDVTFNADSTLKTYQHIEPSLNNGLNDSEGLIFYYSKIAK